MHHVRPGNRFAQHLLVRPGKLHALGGDEAIEHWNPDAGDKIGLHALGVCVRLRRDNAHLVAMLLQHGGEAARGDGHAVVRAEKLIDYHENFHVRASSFPSS